MSMNTIIIVFGVFIGLSFILSVCYYIMKPNNDDLEPSMSFDPNYNI